MTSLFCEKLKTTRILMKDSVWIFVALSAVVSVAKAFDRPILSPKCPSNENPSVETLLSHPGDCEKFYKCLNGLAYPISCPVGLYWNPLLNKCDYPDVVNCHITQARKAEYEYNPLCPLDENSSNPTHLPNKIDCGQFYKCLGGNAYAMTCPSGQHWSEELSRCEHPNVANCQRKEVRTLIGNGDLNDNCPLDDDPDNPTLLSYPTDCGKFIKCSYGRSYILSCPYGLHWDVKSNRCESRFVAKCNSGESSTPSITGAPSTGRPTITSTLPTPIITPPTTPTIKPTQDPNLPVPTPECSDPSSLRKFNIPGECKAFLQCYQGLAYRVKCREGREWSVTANDCIDAALAGCSATSGSDGEPQTAKSTSTTSTTTSRTTTKTPTTCTEGVEYISHLTDCTKYIQCDNGKPIERDCPPRTYWSKTLKNCQWTSNDCR